MATQQDNALGSYHVWYFVLGVVLNFNNSGHSFINVIVVVCFIACVLFVIIMCTHVCLLVFGIEINNYGNIE